MSLYHNNPKVHSRSPRPGTRTQTADSLQHLPRTLYANKDKANTITAVDVFLNVYREKYRRIGDIMKKFSPFLKLYTEYVKNFKKATTLVDQYEEKSSAFAAMLKEVRVQYAVKPVVHEVTVFVGLGYISGQKKRTEGSSSTLLKPPYLLSI